MTFQFAPGELILQTVFVCVVVFLFGGGYCVSRWVSLDAAARGRANPGLWRATFFVFAPFGGVYLLVRHRLGQRASGPSRHERLLGTIGLPPVTALVIVTTILPPDPFTQLLWYPLVVLVLLGLSYLLVWREGDWG